MEMIAQSINLRTQKQQATCTKAREKENKPEVKCSTTYYTDAEGNVTVSTDSPTISDNYNPFKTKMMMVL